MQIRCVSRKPSKWAVHCDGRNAIVRKTGDSTRSRRWVLERAGEEPQHFRSRREAFAHFENGRKIKPPSIVKGRPGASYQRRRI